MKISLRSKSIIFKILFSVLLICFSISIIILSFKINKDNKTIRNFSQTSEIALDNQNDNIFVICGKKSSFGTVENGFTYLYEAKFVNNKDLDFTNWEILLKVSDKVEISHSWNTEIEQYGNYIVFKAKDTTKVLHKDESMSFAFVLTGPEETEIKEISFSGCFIRKLFNTPGFIVLLFLIILDLSIFIATNIVHHYMANKIKLLKNQKERDDLLIEQTMKTFVQCIDAKDEYTRGHSARVADYSQAIAKQLGYDEKFQKDMYYMGLMHDIGKLAVPDSILNKTSRLSNEEWEIIQLHTSNGARMLKDFSIMPELKDAVLYHHERYDGKGYVNQLKGEDIPLCARIICVADSYDAMNTNRCYRLKFSKERIINEIERCSGKQFDPTIVPAMVELIKSGAIEKL